MCFDIFFSLMITGIGPYEIRFIFSQIPFYFFLNSVLIFLDSVFFRFNFSGLLFNGQIKLH